MCVTDNLHFFSPRFPTVPAFFYPPHPCISHDHTEQCIGSVICQCGSVSSALASFFCALATVFSPRCFINSRGEAGGDISSRDKLFVWPLMLANNQNNNRHWMLHGESHPRKALTVLAWRSCLGFNKLSFFTTLMEKDIQDILM